MRVTSWQLVVSSGSGFSSTLCSVLFDLSSGERRHSLLKIVCTFCYEKRLLVYIIYTLSQGALQNFFCPLLSAFLNSYGIKRVKKKCYLIDIRAFVV